MLELKIPGQIVSFDSLTAIGKIRGNDGKLYKFHRSFVTPKDASVYAGRVVAFVPVMTARGFWAHSIELCVSYVPRPLSTAPDSADSR